MLQAEDQKYDGQCRICLETEGELIIPCLCKTNPVHRNCLDKWRAEVRNGNHFDRCEICHFSYEMELVPTTKNSSRIPFWKTQSAWYKLTMVWILMKALMILVGGISFF